MFDAPIVPAGVPRSRREFLKSSGVAVVGSAAVNLLISRSAHATGNETLKLGLIGCGGRGSAPSAMPWRRIPT